jgi:aminoglycoside 6'-N-acetyltransferase I
MATACRSVDQPEWLALREQLWPHCSATRHRAEMAGFLTSPQRFAQFIEYDQSNKALGFIEASLRTDYVNGTSGSPVAFIEGIYVIPEARKQGVARRLVEEVERWAVNAGCVELASDASFENVQSHAMHAALGFEESERVVFFRKSLNA